MKTVLHLIETKGPGGAETVFINLCDAFHRGDFRSVALVAHGSWVHHALRRAGVSAHTCDSKGSFNFGYLRMILQVVRQRRVDLIEAHLPGASVYASLAGMLTRTPVVSIFHGSMDMSTSDRLLGAKVALINRGSDRIVAVSNHLKDDLIARTGLRAEKLDVVYNGVAVGRQVTLDGNRMRAELGLPERALLVCSVGNIRAAKGYDHLIRAAALMAHDHPEIHFLIAGEGKGRLWEELQAQREEVGVQDTVHFLGFRPNVHALLAGCDLFLLPSTSEGFSIATIEAMAQGIPIIATRSGGPEEIITPDVDGVLIPAGSGVHIAEAVTRLAAAPEERDRLRRNAAATVAKRFSLESQVAAYEAIYRDLLGFPPDSQTLPRKN